MSSHKCGKCDAEERGHGACAIFWHLGMQMIPRIGHICKVSLPSGGERVWKKYKIVEFTINS